MVVTIIMTMETIVATRRQPVRRKETKRRILKGGFQTQIAIEEVEKLSHVVLQHFS